MGLTDRPLVGSRIQPGHLHRLLAEVGGVPFGTILGPFWDHLPHKDPTY